MNTPSPPPVGAHLPAGIPPRRGRPPWDPAARPATGACLALLACGALASGISACAAPGTAPGAEAGGDVRGLDGGGERGTDLGAALVDTAAGPLRGVRGDGVAIFRGIPYAAPPVGAGRWRAPAPPAAWSEIRDATAFGPACRQAGSPFLPDSTLPGEADQSEDCLTLNVWTPARTTADALPVMVFLHGGGWNIGAGSLPTYEGTRLARDGHVVLVTLNYRLGVLGFLAHPRLGAETPGGWSGNYGMADQLLALAWVQDNARAFGGDPGSVTVFGESAGGGSVCHLLVSPPARGLLHRAIVQSANCLGELRDLRADSKTWKSGESLGLTVEGALGCSAAPDPLRCLREARFEDLVRAGGAASGAFDKGEKFWPLVDGHLLPEQPAATFRSGGHARVPLMAGHTADEAALFRPAFAAVATVAAYHAALKLLFGAGAPLVQGAYPVATDAEARPTYERLVTDLVFVCPTRRTLALGYGRGAPTWRFHFAHVHPSGAAAALGAYHGTDLFYVFGNLDPFGKHAARLTTADTALADAAIAYWSRFAATGDPNHPSHPAWPGHDPTSDAHLVLADPPAPGTALRKAACDVLDSLAGP